MKSSEEYVPNERLRRARSLKGWSQADLAEQVGTSFEIVSRWERGVTAPSPYYRERLCDVLGLSAEELGLLRAHHGPSTSLVSPSVLLASSHADVKKPIVLDLKAVLQERGITLWSNRQLSREESEKARTALVIVVIISPEARSSRHVREALEMVARYQLPVYGVWIEGERWQEYLPESNVEPVSVIDVRAQGGSLLLGEIAATLAQAEPFSHEKRTVEEVAPPSSLELPTTASPLLVPPSTIGQQRRPSRLIKGLMSGLVVLLIVAGSLEGFNLLTHAGRGNDHSTGNPIRGGTWTADLVGDLGPPIPNIANVPVDEALYLPLFYQDEQGVVRPGAAAAIPTLQNGGISTDAQTWTIHMRPHLVWSDGMPYDARDVDFTWRLWLNPDFGAFQTIGYDLIRAADVSADNLTIVFHLKRPYVAFYQLWVDGFSAPLPAHHYGPMKPDAIVTSHPKVTSGPFMVEESVVGDHYTLVRNPRYYRASEGMPYLDKLVFRIIDQGDILKDLQAGTIDSVRLMDFTKLPLYQRPPNYTLYKTPTSNSFEAMYFDFHNTVLAHLEVRQAMAMALDHQALINAVPGHLASPLCTDHNSAFHPGYEPGAPCPVFDPAAANKLLDDNGWVKGPDGIRARGGERLEFEYSTAVTFLLWRLDTEPIIQRNLQAIGIKLDIQNYATDVFWGQVVPGGKASPPSGAVAGRYDIAEGMDGGTVDPDDAVLLECNLFTPRGANYGFYCDPALDALLHQEQATVDPGARQQIFRQIHRYLVTKFPFIVLYGVLTSLAMVRKGTHNYQQNPLTQNFYNSWEWWCDNGKC